MLFETTGLLSTALKHRLRKPRTRAVFLDAFAATWSFEQIVFAHLKVD